MVSFLLSRPYRGRPFEKQSALYLKVRRRLLNYVPSRSNRNHNLKKESGIAPDSFILLSKTYA